MPALRMQTPDQEVRRWFSTDLEEVPLQRVSAIGNSVDTVAQLQPCTVAAAVALSLVIQPSAI